VKRIQSLPADTIKQREKYEKITQHISKNGRVNLGIKGTDSIFAKIDLDKRLGYSFHSFSLESSKIGVFDGSVWFRKP
jgi:hypothetical protein